MYTYRISYRPMRKAYEEIKFYKYFLKIFVTIFYVYGSLHEKI